MNKIFLIAASLILVLNACTKDKTEDPDPCAYETSELKYNGLIKNIISSSCSGNVDCHGTPQGQNGGGNLTTYTLLKEKINDGSLNNRVFILKDMPLGSSLSECDLKKLKDWIDAGSPE